ncbi:MAG: hypothetical protein OXG33_15055 [Chloroflexi bacterium]|nr:hypothetical protein [Chloroflexota bacterium]
MRVISGWSASLSVLATALLVTGCGLVPTPASTSTPTLTPTPAPTPTPTPITTGASEDPTKDVVAAWTVEGADALADQIVGFLIEGEPTARSTDRSVLTDRVRENVTWTLQEPPGDDLQEKATAHVWVEVGRRNFEVWVPFILTIRKQTVVDLTISLARARIHEGAR